MSAKVLKQLASFRTAFDRRHIGISIPENQTSLVPIIMFPPEFVAKIDVMFRTAEVFDFSESYIEIENSRVADQDYQKLIASMTGRQEEADCYKRLMGDTAMVFYSENTFILFDFANNQDEQDEHSFHAFLCNWDTRDGYWWINNDPPDVETEIVLAFAANLAWFKFRQVPVEYYMQTDDADYDRSQRARKARNKPLLPRVRKVSLSAVQQVAIRVQGQHEAANPDTAGTGTPKSPHWRRGHYRNYKSGKTWVDAYRAGRRETPVQTITVVTP